LIYRRALKSTTWHFCRNCSFWPRKEFEQRTGVPEEGALCAECKVLRGRENCDGSGTSKTSGN
jgi:hypothetical protein